MKKPQPPAEPAPGNALQNDDWQRRHVQEHHEMHARCEQMGPEAIKVLLVGGSLDTFRKRIAEEWLIYFQWKAEQTTRRWMIAGVVSSVLAAIFGLIAIFAG